MTTGPKIIGVLNVTPDSFYDGGNNVSEDAALAQAQIMFDEGADVIEVGGESSGPGASDVSTEEELQRVIPIIHAIHAAHPSIIISVDTYKADVATAAIEAGASMINDVTAGRMDPNLFAVVAKASVPLVLMYSKDPTPRTTKDAIDYHDVVGHISAFLRERKQAAMQAGVAEKNIILDPGLGWFVSAHAKYSFEIIARLREFQTLGSPLLLSPSRKSFLAGSEQLPPQDRLPATIAASAIAALHGASYIRTHDVEAVRRACEVGIVIGKTKH